jgi:hypothetical protein
VTKIVNPHLQSPETELRPVTGQFGRALIRPSTTEPDDRNAYHAEFRAVYELQ